MTWQAVNGGIPGAFEAINKGMRAGLINRANVVVRAWKLKMREHSGGFTSGKFSTGWAINHITRTTPALGDWLIRVGTNVRYHLFWELGHMNLFTRKYERVETLRPAVQETMDEQEAAFIRGFKAGTGVTL